MPFGDGKGGSWNFYSVKDSLAISYDGGVIYEPQSNNTRVIVKIDHVKGYSTGKLKINKSLNFSRNQNIFIKFFSWYGLHVSNWAFWDDHFDRRRNLVSVQANSGYHKLRYLGVK